MDTEKIKKDIDKAEQKTIFLISKLKTWIDLNPKKAIFILGFIFGVIVGFVLL